MAKHDIWLYDVNHDAPIVDVPITYGDVKEALSSALSFLKGMVDDLDEEKFLFMENKKHDWLGKEINCVLVFASEFPIGILVLNCSLQSKLVGPYSTKTKKIIKNWHKIMPEA